MAKLEGAARAPEAAVDTGLNNAQGPAIERDALLRGDPMLVAGVTKLTQQQVQTYFNNALAQLGGLAAESGLKKVEAKSFAPILDANGGVATWSGNSVIVSVNGFNNLRSTVGGSVTAQDLAKLVVADEAIGRILKPVGGLPSQQSEALTNIVAVYAAGLQGNATLMNSANARFEAAFPPGAQATGGQINAINRLLASDQVGYLPAHVQQRLQSMVPQ